MGHRHRALVFVLALSVAGSAAAQFTTGVGRSHSYGGPIDAQTWFFDETTSGNDVDWTSPSSVDPNASVYSTSSTISVVEVSWAFSFLSGTLDVTDQIPPELQTISSELPGPAPVTLADEPIVFPEPPEPAAVTATISIGLDAGGFGFFSATGVSLGTLPVEILIFGTVDVTITAIRVAGSLTIHPTWFTLTGALGGTYGDPVLAGSGPLSAGELMSLDVSNALESTGASLVVGFSALNAPFKGGTMVPALDFLVLGLATDPTGALSLGSPWPNGIPPNFPFYFQFWITDAAGPKGFSATNAISGLSQ